MSRGQYQHKFRTLALTAAAGRHFPFMDMGNGLNQGQAKTAALGTHVVDTANLIKFSKYLAQFFFFETDAVIFKPDEDFPRFDVKPDISERLS